MTENQSKSGLREIVLLGVVTVLIVFSSVLILQGRQMDLIKPGPGVKEIKMLSDYYHGLKGTQGDTPVYILGGDKPGGTAVVTGGTHPPEIAGPISAILLIENAVVKQGRLIVIPRANHSAASYIPSIGMFGGVPAGYTIPNKNGEERYFRLGDRFSNPVDQWPDPDFYCSNSGNMCLGGPEGKNLNRTFPGNSKGSFTEKIAWGIMEVIRQENAGVSYDIHEATPGSRLAGMLVGNPSVKEMGISALELATMAVLDLEMQDIVWKPERSSETFRGLSHREWGDYSQTFSFLSETENPEWFRTGPFDPLSLGKKFPLKERVGRIVRCVVAVVDTYSMTFPDRTIVIEGMPEYQDFLDKGLSPYLN
ncbi:MAG: hypothetical protein GY866_33590 [Proteobacteria bacterium]|nr:hypothetical protein [Pseudomonadota bacterium]